MEFYTCVDHTNNWQTSPTSTAMTTRNKCEPKFNFHVVQAKQYDGDSY